LVIFVLSICWSSLFVFNTLLPWYHSVVLTVIFVWGHWTPLKLVWVLFVKQSIDLHFLGTLFCSCGGVRFPNCCDPCGLVFIMAGGPSRLIARVLKQGWPGAWLHQTFKSTVSELESRKHREDVAPVFGVNLCWGPWQNGGLTSPSLFTHRVCCPSLRK
jgi:hypothetical protein